MRGLNSEDSFLRCQQVIRRGGFSLIFIADDRVFNAGATDGCGVSPFRVDGKPEHGGPEFAREVAMRKIGA